MQLDELEVKRATFRARLTKQKRAADDEVKVDAEGRSPFQNSDATPNPDARPQCPKSPADERRLKRTLGCPLPEFVAKVGTHEAVRRAKAELRNAKRARSGKLHALWSAVLARIDHGGNEDAIGAKRATGRRPFGPRLRRQSHEGPAEAAAAVISLASMPGPSCPVIPPDLPTIANAPRPAEARRTGVIQPVRAFVGPLPTAVTADRGALSAVAADRPERIRGGRVGP